MGARPMTRLIKEKIKKPLAEEVLFGSLSSGGGQVEVTVEADDICLHIEEAVQLTPA
jgi:ATP-dependent Clp protease ATP-binding subunit ClpA